MTQQEQHGYQTPKRKRIILHAGLPKTGTSALQDLLAHNRSTLLEHGYCYPPDDNEQSPHPNHRFLIQELRKDPSLPRTKAAIEEGERQGAHTIIFSIEGLSSHVDRIQDDCAQALLKMAEGYDLAIYIVLRDQAGWLGSMYKQSVVNPFITTQRASGLEETYSTDLTAQEFAKLPEVLKVCDKEALAQRFTALFPKAAIQFEDYGRDITDKFVAFCGVPSQLLPLTHSQVNIMPPDCFVEILRQTNARLKTTSAHHLLKFFISSINGGTHSELAQYRKPKRARLVALQLLGALRRVKHVPNPPLKFSADELMQAVSKLRRHAWKTVLLG